MNRSICQIKLDDLGLSLFGLLWHSAKIIVFIKKNCYRLFFKYKSATIRKREVFGSSHLSLPE